jgi:hypothetical protein
MTPNSDNPISIHTFDSIMPEIGDGKYASLFTLHLTREPVPRTSSGGISSIFHLFAFPNPKHTSNECLTPFLIPNSNSKMRFYVFIFIIYFRAGSVLDV